MHEIIKPNLKISTSIQEIILENLEFCMPRIGKTFDREKYSNIIKILDQKKTQTKRASELKWLTEQVNEINVALENQPKINDLEELKKKVGEIIGIATNELKIKINRAPGIEITRMKALGDYDNVENVMRIKKGIGQSAANATIGHEYGHYLDTITELFFSDWQDEGFAEGISRIVAQKLDELTKIETKVYQLYEMLDFEKNILKGQESSPHCIGYTIFSILEKEHGMQMYEHLIKREVLFEELMEKAGLEKFQQ
jgi:uncharacterized protein YaaR (DUF327 family)